MDIAGLKQDDYEVWMRFQDAEVLVRYVSADEIRDINNKATRRSWDGKHQPVSALDTALVHKMLGRASVRGWCGITLEGAEFPYTPENCDFLMERWTEFIQFVQWACSDLAVLVAAQQETAAKNSALTSGADSHTRV